MNTTARGAAPIGTPMQDPLRAAFEDHYVAVVRLSALLCGRYDVAEDIAQEAFVRVAPRISRLEPEQVRPYLRRTAVNLWKNRLRRLAVERRLGPELPRDPPEGTLPVEERDVLWQAVLRLPERQRACLVLRYYEDPTENATAQVLGCSVGAVKSHTNRALVRLRKGGALDSG